MSSEVRDLENHKEEHEYYLKSSSYIKDYKLNTENKGNISKNYIKDCLSDNYNLINSHKGISDLKCEECNIDLILNHKEANAVCPSCGMVEEFQDNDICNEFSEEIEVLSPFSYKKINHFKEWLSMFLGRESSSPPEEVIDILLMELKKDRIKDKKLITKELIRGYLRKNNLNKLYEHTYSLIYRICRVKPPEISKELENKLITMFEEIQPYFLKHKPKDRKNFLSYSYVLYKLCQLLGQDHLLSEFSLLKSREKLHQQDQIWSLICRDIGWEFVPSI